jgi:hypothetical protein
MPISYRTLQLDEEDAAIDLWIHGLGGGTDAGMHSVQMEAMFAAPGAIFRELDRY